MSVEQTLTESTYLQYIPILVENKTTNAVILMVIPAFFYILASYGHFYYSDLPVVQAILVSILFASVEYVFRVPVNKYAHDVAGLSAFWIQIIWVTLSILMARGVDFVLSK